MQAHYRQSGITHILIGTKRKLEDPKVPYRKAEVQVDIRGTF